MINLSRLYFQPLGARRGSSPLRSELHWPSIPRCLQRDHLLSDQYSFFFACSFKPFPASSIQTMHVQPYHTILPRTTRPFTTFRSILSHPTLATACNKWSLIARSYIVGATTIYSCVLSNLCWIFPNIRSFLSLFHLLLSVTSVIRFADSQNRPRPFLSVEVRNKLHQ